MELDLFTGGSIMKIKSFPQLQRLTVASEISEARRKTNYAKLALFSSCTKECKRVGITHRLLEP